MRRAAAPPDEEGTENLSAPGARAAHFSFEWCAARHFEHQKSTLSTLLVDLSSNIARISPDFMRAFRHVVRSKLGSWFCAGNQLVARWRVLATSWRTAIAEFFAKNLRGKIRILAE